jgi:hypothetical protein
VQEREYRVDAELVGVLGCWGTLGPVTGGELRLVLRGGRVGRSFGCLHGRLWSAGGRGEWVRSIVIVKSRRRMVVSGLKEWLLTLGGLREVLVRHELMLKMTRGMLGK